VVSEWQGGRRVVLQGKQVYRRAAAESFGGRLAAAREAKLSAAASTPEPGHPTGPPRPSRLRTFLDPPNSRQATAFLMSSLPKMLGATRRWISARTSGRLANSWKAVISSLLQGGWWCSCERESAEQG
jgi:hypothetical protein